jgi:hypothetical protein
MYDSHGLELYTMYDSHGVYLRVLWSIYIYKFSRCHVVFYGFFVLFTDFRQKSPGFCQTSPENHHANFKKKIADLSVKLAEFRYSQFSLFLRRLRCVSTEFSQILPIFPKFFKNRRNCSGLVFLLRLNFRTLVVPRRVRRCLGRREELKKAGQAVATTASASAAATPESAKWACTTQAHVAKLWHRPVLALCTDRVEWYMVTYLPFVWFNFIL